MTLMTLITRMAPRSQCLCCSAWHRWHGCGALCCLECVKAPARCVLATWRRCACWRCVLDKASSRERFFCRFIFAQGFLRVFETGDGDGELVGFVCSTLSSEMLSEAAKSGRDEGRRYLLVHSVVVRTAQRAATQGLQGADAVPVRAPTDAKSRQPRLLSIRLVCKRYPELAALQV